MQPLEDTIVAIATASGSAGLAVLRVMMLARRPLVAERLVMFVSLGVR